jgi:hypothetical protein
VLPPHDSKVFKRVQRHVGPAEITRLYLAHSLVIAQPNTVDALYETWQRCVEMLEHGVEAAAALVDSIAALGREPKLAFPTVIARHFGIQWFLHYAIRNVHVHALQHGRVTKDGKGG